MATFNFSTMQMTVKVVYYGPGLCGKTTNLQFIYNHTAPKSRGEMVSLETKSDRTLFFDLLPLEVGTIAGFKTKIQLYTVPGQVFYNTTRKLVLKGVDGIVFVADSQRPMLPSNIESLGNLQTNLSELGIVMDTVPLVFQYNKRDLDDICTVEELHRAMNGREAPAVEASALTGLGVFETLRAISRLTLGALKRQLEEGPSSRGRPQAAAMRSVPSQQPATPSAANAPAAGPRPVPQPTIAGRPGPVRAAPAATPSPEPASIPASSAMPAPSARPAAAAALAPPAARPRAVQAQAPPQQTRSATVPGDGSQAGRDFLLNLKRADFERAHRLSLSVRVEDAHQQLVHEIRDLELDLRKSPDPREKLLQLNIRLNPEG